MSNEGIRFFLPFFLLFFVIIIFFWRIFFKRKSKYDKIEFNLYNKKKFGLINRCSIFFKSILILYSLIIIIFIYFPDFYNHYFYPIEKYDTSNINGIGFHLLKITLVWLIAVQVYIDRLLLNKRWDKNKNKKQSLLVKAHEMLLVGMFLLFVFYSLIATNYYTLTLMFVAALTLIVQIIIVLLIPNRF